MPRGTGLAIFAKETKLDEKSPEGEGEHRKNTGRYQDSIRRPGREPRSEGHEVHDEENHVKRKDRPSDDERRETGNSSLGPLKRSAHGCDLQ
jgi:hypothetical protein